MEYAAPLPQDYSLLIYTLIVIYTTSNIPGILLYTIMRSDRASTRHNMDLNPKIQLIVLLLDLTNFGLTGLPNLVSNTAVGIAHTSGRSSIPA